MVAYITLLLLCQLAGEVIARLFSLPVPGPVIGMAILFLGLVLRGRVPSELEKTTSGLLRYLSLLFVPAGVGVLAHWRLLSDSLAPVIAAITLGTLTGIGVTGWVMQYLKRSRQSSGGERR